MVVPCAKYWELRIVRCCKQIDQWLFMVMEELVDNPVVGTGNMSRVYVHSIPDNPLEYIPCLEAKAR